MRGKRRHSQYPFLPRHPSEKEQRDKRSRWMEMELMVKESVTGSNKSEREWAAVSDRKIWTKTGYELEADMEGGEGRWKLSTRRSDWGTGSVDLNKGSDRWEDSNLLAVLRSCSITHLKINRLAVPFAGADPGPRWPSQCRSYHVHYLSVNQIVTTFPSPAYSGHSLRSPCLRWASGSRVFVYRKV